MLTIVFENCEVMDVSKEQVTYMNIWGITESLNYSQFNKRTVVLKHVKGFNIGINSPESSLVDRCLQYKDITQIRWEGITYFMNWADDESDENSYQTVNVSDNGIMHIAIYKEGGE